MVKLLILSDIHSQNITLINILEKVRKLKEPPQYCLIAGDITNFGTRGDLNHILNIITERIESVFFVTGNCDPVIKNDELLTDAVYAESNVGKIEFFKIVGFGTHKPKLNQKILSKLRKTGDYVCLLTHAPPYKTQADMISLGKHIGSIELRDFIQKNPHIFLVISGHIHDSPTITKLDGYTLVNPGPVTTGNFALIDIKPNFEINGKIVNLYEM